MKKRIAVLLILFIFSTCFFSCAKSQETANGGAAGDIAGSLLILGTWSSLDASDMVGLTVFTASGELYWTSAPEVVYHYEVKKGRLKVTDPGSGITSDEAFSITDGTLIIEQSNTMQLRFERVEWGF